MPDIYIVIIAVHNDRCTRILDPMVVNSIMWWDIQFTADSLWVEPHLLVKPTTHLFGYSNERAVCLVFLLDKLELDWLFVSKGWQNASFSWGEWFVRKFILPIILEIIVQYSGGVKPYDDYAFMFHVYVILRCWCMMLSVYMNVMIILCLCIAEYMYYDSYVKL